MLLWDRKGREAAVAFAVGLLAEDRRLHFFYLSPWTERLADEEETAAEAEIIEQVRAAYAARAKSFPDLAEEAKRYASMLR